jgi:hypothetical protein
MKVRPFAIKALIAVAAVMAAGAVTATSWHTEPREPAFQGWVEANFVFVGADEIGRVESRPDRRCSRSMPISSATPSGRPRQASSTPSRRSIAPRSWSRAAPGRARNSTTPA